MDWTLHLAADWQLHSSSEGSRSREVSSKVAVVVVVVVVA